MTGADMFDFQALRRDYEGPSLDDAAVDPDPIGQFRQWFDEAIRGGVPEPNAMALSTVDVDGQPWQRTVLLKGFGDEGFEFFTNYGSFKASQIRDNPRVSLLFGWYHVHRQIIVTGTASRVSREETEQYFARRPHGAQLAAWASRQSHPLSSRTELDNAYQKAAEQFGENVPAPEHWGGFMVRPRTIEFWQGRENRLHDRVRFTYSPHNGWAASRLAP